MAGTDKDIEMGDMEVEDEKQALIPKELVDNKVSSELLYRISAIIRDTESALYFKYVFSVLFLQNRQSTSEFPSGYLPTTYQLTLLTYYLTTYLLTNYLPTYLLLTLPTYLLLTFLPTTSHINIYFLSCFTKQ